MFYSLVQGVSFDLADSLYKRDAPKNHGCTYLIHALYTVQLYRLNTWHLAINQCSGGIHALRPLLCEPDRIFHDTHTHEKGEGFWDANRNLSEPIGLQHLRYWILQLAEFLRPFLHSYMYIDTQAAFPHRFTQLAPLTWTVLKLGYSHLHTQQQTAVRRFAYRHGTLVSLPTRSDNQSAIALLLHSLY